MIAKALREYPGLIAGLAVLTVLLATAVYIVWSLDPMRWVDFILHRDTEPVLFIALWAILPIIGFPITVFLVLAGVKFGILWGMVLTGLIMPIHMTASYALAKSLLHKPLKRLLTSRGYSLPDPSNRRVATGLIVFMALPGPSYAMKNYLLALLDMPFFSYLAMNWCIQGLLELPIIGLSGAAAQKDWTVFGLFAALVVVLLVIRWRIRKTRSQGEAKG